MLEKLRSRHPIDLPAEEWKRSRVLLAVLGGIAVLFVLVPLGLALVAAASDRNALFAIAAGVGALVLALAVAGFRGKPGHARK